MPNEVLYWSAVKWGKENGYRFFDMVYIDPRGGVALVEGQPLPDAVKNSATFFKLGFGGRVMVLPAGYEYLKDPVLRSGYRIVTPPLYRSSTAWRALNKLRRSWLPGQSSISTRSLTQSAANAE
jgi:hypothetical protein